MSIRTILLTFLAISFLMGAEPSVIEPLQQQFGAEYLRHSQERGMVQYGFKYDHHAGNIAVRKIPLFKGELLYNGTSTFTPWDSTSWNYYYYDPIIEYGYSHNHELGYGFQRNRSSFTVHGGYVSEYDQNLRERYSRDTLRYLKMEDISRQGFTVRTSFRRELDRGFIAAGITNNTLFPTDNSYSLFSLDTGSISYGEYGDDIDLNVTTSLAYGHYFRTKRRTPFLFMSGLEWKLSYETIEGNVRSDLIEFVQKSTYIDKLTFHTYEEIGNSWKLFGSLYNVQPLDRIVAPLFKRPERRIPNFHAIGAKLSLVLDRYKGSGEYLLYDFSDSSTTQSEVETTVFSVEGRLSGTGVFTFWNNFYIQSEFALDGFWRRREGEDNYALRVSADVSGGIRGTIHHRFLVDCAIHIGEWGAKGGSSGAGIVIKEPESVFVLSFSYLL